MNKSKRTTRPSIRGDRTNNAQAVERTDGAAMGKFALDMANELRQPLTALQNFTATLLDLLEDGQYEKVRKRLPSYRERLTRNVARMSGAIDDLGRTAQYAPESFHPIRPEELLEWAREASASAFAAPRPVRLEWRVEALPAFILGEEAPLRRMLLHLLTHACEGARTNAMPVVCVQTRVIPGLLEISVSDNGTGCSMTPTLLEANALTKAPLTSARPGDEGKGMDLALALGLGRTHPGTLLVRAAEQGGTCMRLRLPLAGAVS